MKFSMTKGKVKSDSSETGPAASVKSGPLMLLIACEYRSQVLSKICHLLQAECGTTPRPRPLSVLISASKRKQFVPVIYRAVEGCRAMAT